MASPLGQTARYRIALAWAARALVLIAFCAGILMQLQAKAWLPPDNSISQYANTPGRWSFVTALLALGSSLIVIAAMVPPIADIERIAGWTLRVAGVGFILAAIIPAPALDEHNPLGDVVHQTGAICGTFAWTIGGLLLSWRYRQSASGRAALVAACAGAIALVLLALSNFNLDVIGIGRRESWALHQSISLVCMMLVAALLPSALLDRGTRKGEQDGQ